MAVEKVDGYAVLASHRRDHRDAVRGSEDQPHRSVVAWYALGCAADLGRSIWREPFDLVHVGSHPLIATMFTRIGLPQLGLIIVILVAFIIYTQRHRF